MTRLAIVGTGYVGLVTGACLAARGIEVVCIDRDEERVAAVRAGRSPFHEPGLDELLGRTIGQELDATTDLGAGIRGAEVVMIAVGTPSRDGRIDLSQVVRAAEAIGACLETAADYPVVVVKSTVVPGTTRDVVRPALETSSGMRAGHDFGVAVNPEFLTEGTAIADFEQPDRIVIGADDGRSAEVVERLYVSFPGAPRIVTGTTTAELIKYASNTLLALLISYSNELADLASAVGGVDVVDVLGGVHTSRYLTVPTSDGPMPAPIVSFLHPGAGYGGSCLPKDTQALIGLGDDLGLPMSVLRAVESVNADRPGAVVELTDGAVGGLDGRRIAVLGLSFRPDTDDVRESPALPVIRGLVRRGAAVVAHDPVAIKPAAQALAGLPVAFEPDLATAIRDVAGIVIVTRWADYDAVPALIEGRDPQPVVVDGRRMLAPSSIARYAGVGR
jgi:UDPglucose 6-dehydrogenase/GDP-mannose 6-dehydrogenase